MFQATPSKVAASQQGFDAWHSTSGVHWITQDNPTIQKIRRDVQDMSELVVPQEWRDPDYHLQYDKLNATDFRKAVISAASSTSFKASDDIDSFAIFAAFHTLLALHQDIRSRHGKNDATFRRNIDALVTDVFAHQYVVDGKPEFGDGNFHALLEEGIWLKENHVTTSEAHPDALVAYGPISADHIHLELENVIALESTTISPSQLPLSPLPPMPASTDDNPNPVALSSALQIERVAKLYTNVHFQHNVSDDPYLFLLAVLLEYKSGTSLHKFHQLAMDFTTAQLQRRALRLKERTLFGLALGRDGAFVYASFWSDNKIAIGWDAVHVFPFQGNVPAQIVNLFLFLRRLAKSMTAQLAEDRQAVASNASKIALNFQRGLTVWRTCKSSMPPPRQPSAAWGPGGRDSGPHSHSSPHGSDGPPAKRHKSEHRDALTGQNLSRFDQCQWIIEHWAVRVKSECAMGGEPMEDLDQEEPCMYGEASVPCRSHG